MTSDLRAAAQQALEALEFLSLDFFMLAPISPGREACNKAITALRAALAEPAQEPVAWRWGYRSVTTGEMDWRGYVEIATDPKLRSPAIMEPLYTAPPQHKPLTDEEIEQEYKKGYADGYAAGYDNGDSEGFTRGTDSMVPASLAAWRAETKPLTEAQIYAAIRGIDSLKAVEVARAIERAHGIT